MIITGNCLDKMKEMQESSIDCIVTDPPYGYSFMGKDWDKVVIGTDIWKECLRVLKPGGFAFVMSAPRQDVLSRMMINLENSGFETGFTSIYWTYASGFPKGMNMSKAIDKRLGEEPTKIKLKDYTGPEFADKQFVKQGSMMQTHETAPRLEQWDTKPTTDKAKKMEGSYAGYQPKPAVEVIIVCMKPLSEDNYVSQAMENGKGVTWLNDCRIPHNDPPKVTDRKERAKDTTFSSESCGFKSELQKSSSASQEGRYPANLMVSDNVLDVGNVTKAGKTRVRKEDAFNQNSYGKNMGQFAGDVCKEYNDEGDFSRYFDLDKWKPEGRYPSNLVVNDDTLDDGKEHKSGKMDQDIKGKQFNTYGKMYDRHVKSEGGTGTFSRFFDGDQWWANFVVIPKASKSEKNKGLGGFKEKGNDRTNQNWKCKKCGKFQLQGNGDICKCEKPDWEKGKSKNNHPTVKPLKLMSYLITLGSRPDDVILDPFSGSGTTCVAAKMIGRKYIGIELNPEYVEIANARLEAV